MEEANVILITIDALRAGHLSCLGYPRHTTPNLDQLADEGALFLQAISNGPHTRYSFPSILTSTYAFMYDRAGIPLKLGGGPLSKHRITIAEVLKGNGYSTAAFNSNPLISSHYSYDRGFDTFENFLGKPLRAEMELRIKKKRGIFPKDLVNFYKFIRKFIKYFQGKATDQPNAYEINQRVISWLRTYSQKKFFVWLHYLDVHFPYFPPLFMKSYSRSISTLEMFSLNDRVLADVRARAPSGLAENELRKIIGLYDDGVRNVDCAIGLLFDKLKKLGTWLGNTYIIVTADHGEEFADHGEVGHYMRACTRAHALYDELLHVPLIIAGPGIQERTVIKNQVGLLDLAPTILDLLGIEEIQEFQGKSSLPLVKGTETYEKRNVISEGLRDERDGSIVKSYSYRTEKWKFILVVNGDKRRCELYDLEKDPEETDDLARKEAEKVGEFEARIMEHISMERASVEKAERITPKPIPYTAEMKERLRELGYL